MVLRTVTPKLFKYYEDQARNAKFMTATGLQSAISGKDANHFT